MKEIKSLSIDILKLIRNSESHGYSFAAWQSPDQAHQQFIIDLDAPKKLEGGFRYAETGFLVNKFSDHHRTKPLLIKSDIKVDLNTKETLIDPRLSDNKIEAFLSAIENSNCEQNSTSIEYPSNKYEALVQKSIASINTGKFNKVVLSRYKDIKLDNDFDSFEFFKKVCATYPRAFCSMFFIPKEGIWIGASPEVLIDSTERMFKTVSLAGTKKLKNDESLADISWTQKEIEEQAIVSRYIINCFKKLRLREFDEYGPKTVQAGNLLHLKTEFKVDLSEVAFDGLGDQMMELLHPTSAVCGMPLDQSLDFIKKEEGFDRSYFSGFMGPVNENGRTQLFVNLRCMNVNGNSARLFAGAGITEDSDPQKEFQETEMKMDVMLDLINS